MNSLYKDLIYLLTCSVNKFIPEKEKIYNMDLDNIYKISKFNSVSATICIALENAGIKDERFIQDYKKAVRKNIMLDIEREAIFKDFENNQIWYMPLKGSVLKDIYSENGMRQMADNDILFNKKMQNNVKNIMLERGYKVTEFRKNHHDVYMKKPIYNFELHTDLFARNFDKKIYNYYKDIKIKLKKDEGNNYGYHFSDEDFYVYITAHEWKHYNMLGSGIRSLLDCYVYLKNKRENLNWEYINKQVKELGINDFEEKRRNLALKVFSTKELPHLNKDEIEMLEFYLLSGTYGNFENNIRRKLKGQSKFSFIMHSIFIPRNQMEQSVKFTSKSILLYPIGVIWRCFRIVLFRRKKLKITIVEVKKNDKKKI